MVGLPFSISKFKSLLSVSTDVLYLDIGSSTTRIALKGKVVWEQPTCIVLHRDSNAVVAIGQKALALVGKAPGSVAVVFPVQKGVIANTQAFVLLLETVFQELSLKNSLTELLLGHTAIVSVPGKISKVEVAQLRLALKEVGISKVRTVDAGKAQGSELIQKPSPSQAYCLLDIGGQTSQLTFLSGEQIFASETVQWGGVQFTELVQMHVRKTHQCVIGWHEAEKVKIAVGFVPIIDNKGVEQSSQRRVANRKVAVRGKDIVTQISKTVVVTSEELQADFSHYLLDLFRALELVFFAIPSEITTSALEQGVFLSGGGSQLEGLALSLSNQLQTSVHVSKQPSEDVIRGLLKQQ